MTHRFVPKISYIWDKNRSGYIMQSVAKEIEIAIKRRKRGKIYFADDFAKVGSAEAVKKTLMRLSQSGMLVRLAHGIYLYPQIDKKFGLGVLYPSVEAIAKEIARRDHARIVPTGSYALNALGLSTQVPTNIVFATDGTSRKIKVYNQQIIFKHVTPKSLSYRSDLLMLVVYAVKEIGERLLTDEDIKHFREVLSHESKDKIMEDMRLMPVWIQKIIRQII
jgi:hypothetical protein